MRGQVEARPVGLAALVVVLLGLLPGLLLAPPAQADEPARRAAPVVRVGTEGTYPPFTYKDPRTNQLTGYDIEVIRAVAKEAGWRLKFVQSTFDAIFPALDAKRIDVIANQVTINPERQARYRFSTPYTYSHGVIVTAAGNTSIKTLADLRGRTTAQSLSSNWAQVAKDAGAKVQSVEGFAQAAALVQQGRVDAIVNDNIAVLDYLASTGSKRVKIAGNAGSEVSRQALTFRTSDTDLARQADQALAALRRDGTLRRISEKYFGADVTVAKAGALDVKRSDSQRSTPEVLRDTAWPMLRGLLRGTIPLTVISFAIGLVLALAAALARLSRNPLLDLPARFYISVIRGTPLLVQLFIVFFGLPEIGIKLPGFVAACLALSLNVGGYAAEIIRASILSVPRGQFEAATTIGMGYAQSLRRIVLPQGLRIAVPPLSNTLLSLVKDTSLVAVVQVTEMFREAQDAATVSNRFLALYAFAALYFWVVCFLLSLVQRRLEGRLERFAV
jgi:cystine transport system permease protein